MTRHELPAAPFDFTEIEQLFDKPGVDGLPELKLPKRNNEDARQSLDQILARTKDAAGRCIAFRCRMKTLITERLTG
jgi:hypothetical protein